MDMGHMLHACTPHVLIKMSKEIIYTITKMNQDTVSLVLFMQVIKSSASNFKQVKFVYLA